MKNNAPLITIIILGILAISACARQPAQQAQQVPSIVSDPTSEAPSQMTVSTSIPVKSGPISQITPAPVTDGSTGLSAGGQKTVTLADKGKTITLVVGERFLLQLGEAYTWDISLSDESVISRVKNIAVIKGAQGVYEAVKAGTVTLAATGDPLCRQSKPACGMPSILFEITIVVK